MINKEYQEVLSYLYEGVYVVDKRRKIIFWNLGSEQITGYKADEVINRYCHDNILQHVTADGTQLCFGGCPLHHTLQTGEVQEAKVFLHHKNGHRVPVTVKSIPVYDEEKNIVAAIEVFTDSRYKKATYEENRKLKELLTTDDLTGIANRRYLDFHLSNISTESKDFKTKYGILFFDIDHFKGINDTYGHNIGDEILILVSQTLNSNIRGEDKVGRWGGEEFIAILKVENDIELRLIAEKLRILVSESFYKIDDNKRLGVTISIGGTMLNESDSIESLISRADANMYKAKSAGRNKVIIE